MDYEVKLSTLKPEPVAVIRTRAKPEEFSRVVPALCGEAWEAAKKHSEVQVSGALMLAVYRHEAGSEDVAVEVGLQVSGPFEGDGRLVSTTLPSGDVASCAHIGPYHKLGEAHDAIHKWCDENGRTPTGVVWEVYGHWTDDEALLRTDVFHLLEPQQRAEYKIHLDVMHGHQELIDVPGIVKACQDPWWNQTLSHVNESVVRLGIVQGEFHWHKHDQDDEFFFVLSGRLFIDVRDSEDGPVRTIELGPHQGTTISKGVLHCPRAPEKTVMLMVETSGIVPTGD